MFALLSNYNLAQKISDENLVQLSGVVVDRDSLTPLPFTTVLDKSTKRGTVTDYYGFYSFVSKPGDTIEFSYVGYKKSFYVLPDTLSNNRYSLIHVMEKDTVMSAPVDVYPWPSRDQLADYFVNHKPMGDELEIARNNLAGDKLSALAENMPTGSSLAYKWDQQQFQDKLYYNGGAPPLNLLNPVAWAKFIDYWKKGKFKRQ
jgi:hypothetical protein